MKEIPHALREGMASPVGVLRHVVGDLSGTQVTMVGGRLQIASKVTLPEWLLADLKSNKEIVRAAFGDNSIMFRHSALAGRWDQMMIQSYSEAMHTRGAAWLQWAAAVREVGELMFTEPLASAAIYAETIERLWKTAYDADRYLEGHELSDAVGNTFLVKPTLEKPQPKLNLTALAAPQQLNLTALAAPQPNTPLPKLRLR
jgi:hypothetical protein